MYADGRAYETGTNKTVYAVRASIDKPFGKSTAWGHGGGGGFDG